MFSSNIATKSLEVLVLLVLLVPLGEPIAPEGAYP